jgi:hypothetical protein
MQTRIFFQNNVGAVIVVRVDHDVVEAGRYHLIDDSTNLASQATQFHITRHHQRFFLLPTAMFPVDLSHYHRLSILAPRGKDSNLPKHLFLWPARL